MKKSGIEHMQTNTSSSSAPQRVLQATLVLFSQKGYFSTSVHDIARQSGVSVGSIYHHFKDKEGVASVLFDSLLERMNIELERIENRYETAHDKCRAVVELLFEITENEAEVMEYMLYSKHREFLSEKRPICSSHPFRMMREMVEQGMESGEVRRMDVMTASSCLYGGAIRMITSRLDGLLEEPLHSYLEDVWSCCWKGVAA